MSKPKGIFASAPWFRTLAGMAMVTGALACGPEIEKADLVLLNGRVWTGNSAQPWAEAVAIRGNRIAAVGTTSEIQDHAGVHTRSIDLGGRLLVPGLSDAHVHFLSGSLSLRQLLLDSSLDADGMLAQVKQWADANPDSAWILGRGWNYSQFPDGKFPSRQDLDRVVAERPVALEAYDGHTYWLNSRALEQAGIDRTTSFEGYGRVIKDPSTGEPTGILTENASTLVARVIPEPSEEEKLLAARDGLAEARRYGITSILNATGSADDFRFYERMLRAGTLTARTAIALTFERHSSAEAIEKMRELAQRYQGPVLKAGYVKLFADGVIESHTAALLEPYADAPEKSGTPNFSAEELNLRVQQLDAAGLNILIHAIGDRAVRMALDAYERARLENPPRDRRHRIEHIEIIDEADLPRFRPLGVVASMQPLHGMPDPDGVWSRNLGPERLPRAFAWRSVRDAGARLVHGSDWPVVTLNPFHGIYTAVTRGYLDGRPEPRWAPEQAITLEEALTGYTLDPAYAAFEERWRGSIAPGKWADMAVLSQDLFKIPVEDIPKTESLLTLFDGKIVHRAGPFASLR